MLSRQHWQITVVDFFAKANFFAKFFAWKPQIFCTMAKGKYSNFKDIFLSNWHFSGNKKAPKQTTVKKNTSL
jgi:hypothetical protein